jgi:hypothetical protein
MTLLTVAGAGPEGRPITERRRDGKIANRPTSVPLRGFDVAVRKVIYSTTASADRSQPASISQTSRPLSSASTRSEPAVPASLRDPVNTERVE